MSDFLWDIDNRIRAANAETQRIGEEILKLTERQQCTREMRYALEEIREKAQMIEARRAADSEAGAVADESMVAESDAPEGSSK